MSKKQKEQKQGAPFQFRPGPELEQLVREFAQEKGLPVNEACKALIALAIAELDRRFYGLVDQLAAEFVGTNAFVRACTHIQTTLQGARLATDSPIQNEPQRANLILETVRRFLAAKGRSVDTSGLWFLRAEETAYERAEEPDPELQPTPKKLRRISKAVLNSYADELRHGW